MFENLTQCLHAQKGSVSTPIDAFTSASLWHLAGVAIVAALVLHLIMFPILRLVVHNINVILFIITSFLSFGGLVYMQQHTKISVERYGWVQRFDECGSSMFGYV